MHERQCNAKQAQPVYCRQRVFKPNSCDSVVLTEVPSFYSSSSGLSFPFSSIETALSLKNLKIEK